MGMNLYYFDFIFNISCTAVFIFIKTLYHRNCIYNSMDLSVNCVKNFVVETTCSTHS